jgi:4-hydroxy-3-polyprenylbenzoate decarboxylase
MQSDSERTGQTPKRLVVGMSGSSGAQIGVELLKVMRDFHDWETHLVISQGAVRTIELETSYTVAEIEALATRTYSLDDVGASISSGSFRTEGMVVVPCSMKTVSGIANGFSHNLLLRAADVTIKERRRLVMVARETPLSSIHLRNMLTLSEMGGIILPPVLTFYNKPDTIQDMVRHIVGKVTDIFGLEMNGFKRWS